MEKIKSLIATSNLGWIEGDFVSNWNFQELYSFIESLRLDADMHERVKKEEANKYDFFKLLLEHGNEIILALNVNLKTLIEKDEKNEIFFDFSEEARTMNVFWGQNPFFKVILFFDLNVDDPAFDCNTGFFKILPMDENIWDIENVFQKISDQVISI